MNANMNKKLIAVIATTPFIGSECLYAQQNNRPNIIVFIVDDMGWQDTSVPFWNQKTKYNEMYETPNMERLAKQGVMFTQAYACPVSSPTRCSLMTGMNMARHRVTNWTLQRDKPTDDKSQTITLPEWNYNGIAQVATIPHTTSATSFVQLLKENGYHTIHCGKAHWGAIDTPGENPCHFGFNVNITGTAAGGLATYLSERNYGHTRDGKAYALNSIPGLQDYWGTGTFVTEALTKEAIKALDKAKKYDQPFYLYMSHYAVHIPIDKDMRFFPKYVRKGLSDKDAAYASLVEGMDKSLGDIMDWLDKNDESKNTIIVFLGDNGGLATSQEWREGPLYTQNSPLKCGKGSMYEGGIRVPFMVKWNGVVKPDTRNNTSIMIEDLFPTILHMANINSYKVPQIVDGKDIVPLLEGKNEAEFNKRSIVWNFPNIWGNTGPGINLNCAIRQGDWKLIYNYETGEKELYNIPQDIGEKNNLAHANPSKVKELSSILGKKLRQMNAQRPIVTATSKPCAWPDE
jgi:N-acetylgalactosamine-6-sulfatase